MNTTKYFSRFVLVAILVVVLAVFAGTVSAGGGVPYNVVNRGGENPEFYVDGIFVPGVGDCFADKVRTDFYDQNDCHGVPGKSVAATLTEIVRNLGKQFTPTVSPTTSPTQPAPTITGTPSPTLPPGTSSPTATKNPTETVTATQPTENPTETATQPPTETPDPDCHPNNGGGNGPEDCNGDGVEDDPNDNDNANDND